MQYLSQEDLEISKQHQKMEEEWRSAYEKWKDAVEESYKGKTTYVETKPLFDNYIDLCDKWYNFGRENAKAILAKIISE